MKTNLRIGEVLMERGYITSDQMDKALAYQKEHRDKRVGQILIELGFVTESQVLEALAQRLGLDIVAIGSLTPDLTATTLIPRELAERQNLLAVGFEGEQLVVVTNDPLNYFALEEVRQLTGKETLVRLSELAPLQKAIAYYYAEVGAREAANKANLGAANAEAEYVQLEESENGDMEAPIVKLLNSLLDRAISSIVRLADMGLDRYLIANSLVGIVAQRLMRKVCPHCARKMAATPAEKQLLGKDVEFVTRGTGCTQCSGTGYRGRIAIHEIVSIDREMRRMISRGAEVDELEEYAKRTQNMQFLRDKGVALVREGVTTPEELVKVAYYA